MRNLPLPEISALVGAINSTNLSGYGKLHRQGFIVAKAKPGGNVPQWWWSTSFGVGLELPKDGQVHEIAAGQCPERAYGGIQRGQAELSDDVGQHG